MTEVGRQPWIIYGVLRTADAVTPMPGLIVPFLLFTLLYLFLGVVVAWLLYRQIVREPADDEWRRRHDRRLPASCDSCPAEHRRRRDRAVALNALRAAGRRRLRRRRLGPASPRARGASGSATLIADAIGPIWEANHVWLILVVVLLFTCFPPAFAALASCCTSRSP